jgi:hypothetical protein
MALSGLTQVGTIGYHNGRTCAPYSPKLTPVERSYIEAFGRTRAPGASIFIDSNHLAWDQSKCFAWARSKC